MEKKEIEGALALSGKEWKCYTYSTKKGIKQLNANLSAEEVETVYNIIQSIVNENEETSGITE